MNVTKLKAEVNARKVSELVREFAAKIRMAQRSLEQARTVYELLGKDDVPALIKTRQEVMNWAVRRQVLIECWEAISGQVWSSGVPGE